MAGSDLAKPAPPNADRSKETVNTQQIRIAAVMTGGVSLAIWMGGVARELNLLERASWSRRTGPRPVSPPSEPCSAQVQSRYRDLLDLLDVTVDVDVLSGTSAGGLNAAFLAYARSTGAPLDKLRDLWLDVGAFEKLLRDPRKEDLPSLMQGDGVLLTGVDDAIEHMTAEPSVRSDPPPTDVFITTTFLTGETSRFTDTHGTTIQDVDFHGLFRFDERQLAAHSGPRAVGLAARSSASYPGAFEPSFVPYEQSPDDSDGRHPPMKDYANITRDHWAADGGLLMNQPIRPLLETVFDRPASHQVRRALLYVVPSTGPTPDPRAVPRADVFTNPYSLPGALMKDLSAMLHQSIGADLQAIRNHNDRVDSLTDTRLRLAELALRLRECDEAESRLLTERMLADYRARESDRLAQALIVEFMRVLTSMPVEAMPRPWRTALEIGGGAEERCRDAAAAAISGSWPTTLPEPGDEAALAGFGLTAFDGALATVVTILRRAFVLADAAARAELADVVGAVHAIPTPERPDVRAIVQDLLVGSGERPERLVDAAGQAGRVYASLLQGGHTGVDEERTSLLQQAWSELADVVVQARALLNGLAVVPADEPDRGSASGRATGRESIQERRARNRPELATYLAYLFGDGDGGGGGAGVEPPSDVALDLFDLHAATRSMLPVNVDVEQPVELVQVSADTRTALAPEISTAALKLTGLQVEHFGAFYKSSWRANDWMWGRLDGAGWLVSLLLDPRRIAAIAETDAPDGAGSTWFYERLRDIAGPPAGQVVVPATPGPEQGLTEDAIKQELAYLDGQGADVPASLTLTSLWVATALQRWIAAEELPVVAREILRTASLHRSDWATDLLKKSGQPALATAAAQAAAADLVAGKRARAKADQQLSEQLKAAAADPAPAPDLQTVTEQLRSCPVRREKISAELGQPLFMRTVTKALAATTGAARTATTPVVGLRPIFSTARVASLAAYRTTTATQGWPRKMIFAGLVLLVLGVFLAVQGDTVIGIGGMALALAGAYLVVIATLGFGLRLILPLLMVTIVALLLAPVFEVVRRGLFGTGKKHDVGLFGREVIPFLRGPYWHDLVVVGGLLLLITIVGLIVPLVRRRKVMAR